MSQKFQILRCCQCSTFQVHQVKKSTKWDCKMCGEKQSVKRNYGAGTGKECRLHVQKLNSLRGQISEMTPNAGVDRPPGSIIPSFHSDTYSNDTEQPVPSKWCQFVEETDKNESTGINDGPMIYNGTEVVLELPKNRKRKSQSHSVIESGERLKKQTGTFYCNKPIALNSEFHESPLNKIVAATNIACTQNGNSEIWLCSDAQSVLAAQPKLLGDERKRIIKREPIGIFDSPKLLKTSKWATFVEDSAEDVNNDDYVGDDSDYSKQMLRKEPNYAPVSRGPSEAIFSQCNDDDIDKLLDF